MKRPLIALVPLLALVVVGALLWWNLSRPEHGHTGRPAGETPALQTKDVQPSVARSDFLSPAEGERTKVSGQTQPTSLPPAIDPTTLPVRVRPVYGLAGESLLQRLDAVKALGKELNAVETAALSAFLRTRPQGDRPKLDGEAALRNDVMNTLRYQRQPPAGLTDLFIALYRDRQQDEVMRDYAVQHLVSWYEQLNDDVDKRRIREVFTEALSETDSSIAGTALLGMHNLSAMHPEFATPELAAAALRLARDEQASELVRITALQVSAGRGVADALDTALALAETAPTVPLQISAIAAVGALGTVEQRPLLEQLAAGAEPRLRPAAQTALKRMELRLAQAAAPPARN